MFQLKLDTLRLFVTVYKERNFKKAYERINMPQTTAGNAMNSLKEALGLDGKPLFTNSNNEYAPTATADKIYPIAKSIIDQTEYLYSVLHTTDVTEGQLFRIASSDTFNLTFAIRLSQYISDTSNHKLLFDSIPSSNDSRLYSGVIKKFLEGEYDLLIHHNKEIFTHFMYDEVFSDKWVFICPRYAYEEQFAKDSQRVLFELPLMSSGNPVVDKSIYDQTNGKVKIMNNAFSVGLVPEAVLGKNCVGIVPSQIMKMQSVAKKKFKILEDMHIELPDFKLFQFWRSGSGSDLSIEAMRKTVKAVCMGQI